MVDYMVLALPCPGCDSNVWLKVHFTQVANNRTDSNCLRCSSCGWSWPLPAEITFHGGTHNAVTVTVLKENRSLSELEEKLRETQLAMQIDELKQRVQELEQAISRFLDARELAERTGAPVSMTPVMWEAFYELHRAYEEQILSTKQ